MYIDTKTLATRLDQWRAERDDIPEPHEPTDWEQRRKWLSYAGQKARRMGLSPVTGQRTGTGQVLWDAAEVDRILRPSWQAIARRTIRGSGGRGATVRDILEVLRREGHEIHAGTVWAWLRGLRERGLVYQPEHGRWGAWGAPSD